MNATKQAHEEAGQTLQQGLHEVNATEQAHEEADQTRQQSLRKTKKHARSRPCVFCEKFQTNLLRHLLEKHKNLPEVIQAKQMKSSKDRNAAFHVLRKKGQLQYNKKQIMLENPAYERQKSSEHNDDVVLCEHCSGLYARKYFYRHSNICIGDKMYVPKALPLQMLKCQSNEIKEDFEITILIRFNQDKIGEMCRTDNSIMLFVSKLFDKLKSKKDKKSEVKKSVRSDMRRVANIFVEFKRKCAGEVEVSDAADIFIRSNFNYLIEAIESYTMSLKNTLKSGLKISLYYLLRKMAKFQRANYLMKDKDDLATEVEKFQEGLSLNQQLVFGDAVYNLNRKRQETLRRPDQLPFEADVTKLKKYTVDRMSVMLSDKFFMWDTRSYTELRDIAVSRLTLFSARRGGEPARMSVSEWLDADKSVWLDPGRQQTIDEKEKNSFKI